MSEAGKCQICGAALTDQGLCNSCGSNGARDTAPNIWTMVDKIKQMVVLPSKRQGKFELGEAILVNRESNQTYPLKEAITRIGRDDTNDIVIDDTFISRRHADIAFLNGNFWVEDQGSTNGTFINGRRLAKRSQLFAGDRLTVGKLDMTFEVKPGPEPKRFGCYEIVAELGRGGMGIVYQAVDLRSKQMVAIKQLVLGNLEPERLKARRERFRREATLANRLKHGNIVSVYDVKLAYDNSYYVMELLSGHSLRQELERRRGLMSAQDFQPILEQTAAGLAYAHSLHVVHRDVKPDNIFIMADGKVKLTDFGIARGVDADQSHLTKSGAMLGTLGYASPEQLQSARRVDHRADIFSLGVVTYEMLSGVSPFKGEGITDTVLKIASTEATPLHVLVPGISSELASVVDKAMAKRPAERYASVVTFAEEYKRALSAPVMRAADF